MEPSNYEKRPSRHSFISPRIIVFLSRIYAKRGLLLGNPINTLGILRAFRTLAEGRYDVAEVGFKSALKRDHKDYRAYIGLAKVAVIKEDLDEQLRFWDRSIILMPDYLIREMDNLDPWLGKARCLLSMYKFSECRHLSQKLVDNRPDDAQAYFLLARSYMRVGKFAQAVAHWLDAESRFPNAREPVIGRANCLLNAGQFLEAEKLLGIVSTRWPNDVEFTVIRAKLALKVGELELAKAILLNVIQGNPGLVAAYNLLYQSLRGLGEIEAFEALIDKVPARCQLTEEFTAEVLLPYYIERHDWERYFQCLEKLPERRMSARIALLKARYHLLKLEYDALVDFVERIIKKYPYCFPAYELLLRGYQQQNRSGRVRELKSAMMSRFGEVVVYPLLIKMGSRFIGKDFLNIFQWLIENQVFRDRCMCQLLDSLLLSGDQKEMTAIVIGMKDYSTPEEKIRILSLDCLTKDFALLHRSANCELNWLEFEKNLENFQARMKSALKSLKRSRNSQAGILQFCDNYLDTLNRYDGVHIYTSESYCDAATVMVSLLERLEKKLPTSVVRLGDGEGNYLPYRSALEQYAHVDQRAIQNIWWGESLVNTERASEIGLGLIEVIDNADFLGVPPLRRIISETFKHGEFNLTERHNRGNAAVIDLLSSDRLAKNKTLISSAVHNDFFRWDLYKQLFVLVDCVSYISCHDLDSVLAVAYNVKSRQKFIIPGEYAFREMFEARGNDVSPSSSDGIEIQKIYPQIFEKISREIDPRPGELYLIAAGFLGKFFCDLVKRRGGIGLDIGSAADYWVGYETRRYRKNKYAFDPMSSLIHSMPLMHVGSSRMANGNTI